MGHGLGVACMGSRSGMARVWDRAAFLLCSSTSESIAGKASCAQTCCARLLRRGHRTKRWGVGVAPLEQDVGVKLLLQLQLYAKEDRQKDSKRSTRHRLGRPRCKRGYHSFVVCYMTGWEKEEGRLARAHPREGRLPAVRHVHLVRSAHPAHPARPARHARPAHCRRRHHHPPRHAAHAPHTAHTIRNKAAAAAFRYSFDLWTEHRTSRSRIPFHTRIRYLVDSAAEANHRLSLPPSSSGKLGGSG